MTEQDKIITMNTQAAHEWAKKSNALIKEREDEIKSIRENSKFKFPPLYVVFGIDAYGQLYRVETFTSASGAAQYIDGNLNYFIVTYEASK